METVSKKISKWEPEDFELEMTTHWSFPQRGDWATHDAKWRGNWSPYIPRNIILRYSQEGDLVLDQFVGGGTTLVECKLLNRNIIGVDVNDMALRRCREKTAFEHEGADGKVEIRKGDARHLDFIQDSSIDLICTHPPYADIIQYSEGILEDLSHLKVKDFLEEMKNVAAESHRVLKKDKFCAILMGDTRQRGCMVPMSFEVMQVFENVGFKLKELIIKKQHNCKATGYWKTNSLKYNFLLIAHEYLFVFRK
jgi:Predicted DNA modification methylase